MPAHVILNPKAGKGQASDVFREIQSRLRDAFGEVIPHSTEYPGHARLLAQEIPAATDTCMISIGGDGTHGEVVDGLLTRSDSHEPPLAFGPLPAGTGSDFCRYVYGGKGLQACVDSIVSKLTQSIDVGRAFYRDHDGKESSHHFVNIAGAGIGGLVDFLVNHSTKALGGKTSFLIGTVRGLLQYRPATGTVFVDGIPIYEGAVLNVLACNGQFAGGGMHFAPTASLTDGYLDFIVIPMLPKWRLGLEMRRLYDGSYLDNPSILHQKGKTASFKPFSPVPKAYLDLDGECPGTGPVTFSAVPSALTLLGGVPQPTLYPN